MSFLHNELNNLSRHYFKFTFHLFTRYNKSCPDKQDSFCYMNCIWIKPFGLLLFLLVLQQTLFS